MFYRSVTKTSGTLLLSAMMAFPATLWANSESVQQPASATEGVSVLLETLQTPDGHTAYYVMAPVPEEAEAQLVRNLATNSPHNLILGISGPDDPALKAASATGNLASIKTFVISGDPDQAPLLKSKFVSANIREKVSAKIKAITKYCRDRPLGVFAAFFATGAATGFTIYESHSVAAGMAAMIGVGAISIYQSMFSHLWDNYLDKGGEVMVDVFRAVHGWFGHELTDQEKHIYEVSGKFNATLIANTLIDAYIFWNAGTLVSFWQTLWFGFLSSGDINDAHVSDRVKRGKINLSSFDNFIISRIIASAVGDVAGFLNVPYVQITLAAFTVYGLIRLAFGRQIEEEVIPKFKQAAQVSGRNINGVKFSTIRSIRLRAYAARRRLAGRVTSSCEALLGKFNRQSTTEGDL